MSSPVSTSTITATTLLTLMCVDASVSKNQSEYAHVPVSYTHLTLPTICSV
mgnify:CR=1 FL=1